MLSVKKMSSYALMLPFKSKHNCVEKTPSGFYSGICAREEFFDKRAFPLGDAATEAFTSFVRYVREKQLSVAIKNCLCLHDAA